MRTFRRLALRTVVGCLAVAALVGCGKGESLEGRRMALVEHLHAHPDRVAEHPPPGTQVVLLMVGVADGRVRVEAAPIPVGGSLRLERTLAVRRHDLPAFWALQTNGNDEAIAYWTPVDPTARVRVNLPRDSEEQSHVGGLVRVPEMYVALRVPFYPGGRLVFQAADGAPAGAYRFGGSPSSPLVTEDESR